MFRYMGTSLFEGLKSFDSQLCTQCCSSLDFILTHAIAGSTKSKKDESAVALTQLLSQQSHLYCQVKETWFVEQLYSLVNTSTDPSRSAQHGDIRGV